MSWFVDVHTHLTHEAFSPDLDAVVHRAVDAGVRAVVVNGLDPSSNRKILQMTATYPIVRPALGIYPLEAMNHLLPPDFEEKLGIEVSRFDVDEEIKFIESQAFGGHLAAVGECGLDAHYTDDQVLGKEQERVLERLGDIALRANLPLIVHSRKKEKRIGEVLSSLGIKKVNLHCFSGRSSLAKEYAEKNGWWVSIPANIRVNEGFQKIVRILPAERLLTETDAPYLAPERGTRNEPSFIPKTVTFMAELRGISDNDMKEQIYRNYQELFG